MNRNFKFNNGFSFINYPIGEKMFYELHSFTFLIISKEKSKNRNFSDYWVNLFPKQLFKISLLFFIQRNLFILL